MCHDDYPTEIMTGCICAGVMEGDILQAKERDVDAKRRSQRKSHYLKKAWDVIDENKWEVQYKRVPIAIKRDFFRGYEFYKIILDGEQFHWKDNLRMTSFLDAHHYVFDLMEEINERKND